MDIVKVICLCFFIIGFAVSVYGAITALRDRFYKQSTTGQLGLIYGIVGSLLSAGMIVYLILT